MLLNDIQVVAVGMEGCNPQFSALLAVVAVVVVGADDSDVFFPQDLGNATGEGGFSSSTITNNTQNNRALSHGSLS